MIQTADNQVNKIISERVKRKWTSGCPASFCPWYNGLGKPTVSPTWSVCTRFLRTLCHPDLLSLAAPPTNYRLYEWLKQQWMLPKAGWRKSIYTSSYPRPPLSAMSRWEHAIPVPPPSPEATLLRTSTQPAAHMSHLESLGSTGLASVEYWSLPMEQILESGKSPNPQILSAPSHN